MNFPLFIAKRYFFSTKKKTFISILSIISMFGVAVGTMALVIALSVFNGLEDMIRSLYGSFDPDLKVSATRGKSFVVDPAFLEKVQQVEGVEVITEIIEENALVRYQDAQKVVKLKGVGENFDRKRRLEKAVVRGDFKLREDSTMFAVLGIGVKYALSVSLRNEFHFLKVYYPKRGNALSFMPSQLTNRKMIKPSGVFSLEQEYDNYMFVPLEFAAELMEYGNERTALEIQIAEGANLEQVQHEVQETLGADFEVLNSDEQHASLLRAVKIEKLFVYLIFSFILALASFNIFFSLSMLAIDKKKDIAVLYALGATSRTVRNIFLGEGAIIAFVGAATGLSLGLLICWVQQTYQVISMGMQTSLVEAYPVKIQWQDFVFTGLTIVIITLLAAYRPAVIATRSEVNTNL